MLPKDNADEYEGRGFTSRSFNDPIAKRLNKFPKLSEYTRPHFKPTERTTVTSSIPSSTTATSTSSSTSATTFGTHVSSSTTPAASTTATSAEQVFDTQALVTSTSPNATTEAADENLVAVNSTTTTTTTTPSPSVVTVAQIVREQNFSINEIPGQNDQIDSDVAAHSEDDVVVQVDTTLEPVSTTASVSLGLLTTEEEEEEEDERKEEEKEQVLGAAKTSAHETIVSAASSSNHEQQQQFRPRPEYRPPGTAESTSSMSGQLYQDVAAKDQQEPTVLKLRGV